MLNTPDATGLATLCEMGTQLPSPKGRQSPQFSVHVYCGQTSGWTKVPLGTEVGLGLGDIVLDRQTSPPPKKGTAPNFNQSPLWPNGWMDQDATWYEGKPGPRRRCVRWGRSSQPQFSAPVCCGQMAGWMKMPLGTEVDLGPGHMV